MRRHWESIASALLTGTILCTGAQATVVFYDDFERVDLGPNWFLVPTTGTGLLDVGILEGWWGRGLHVNYGTAYYGGSMFGGHGSRQFRLLFTVINNGGASNHLVYTPLCAELDNPDTPGVNEEQWLMFQYVRKTALYLVGRDYSVPGPVDPFTQLVTYQSFPATPAPHYVTIDVDMDASTLVYTVHTDAARTVLLGSAVFALDGSWAPYLQGGYVGFNMLDPPHNSIVIDNVGVDVVRGPATLSLVALAGMLLARRARVAA